MLGNIRETKLVLPNGSVLLPRGSVRMLGPHPADIGLREAKTTYSSPTCDEEADTLIYCVVMDYLASIRQAW